MPAYVIAEAKVSDEERYMQAAKAAPGVLAENGGKFLARGSEMTVFEGSWDPPRLMLIEFPDMDSVRSWYESPIYQKAKEMRAGAAEMNILAIESPR